jgi:cytoskeletal protein CcmA (bactofilin family)
MDQTGIDKDSLYIGDGVTIEGKVRSHGRIEIHGLVSGDVTANEVKIAAGGRVEGAIKASRLDITGFAGSLVNVSELLVVRAHGHIEGDVTYGSIQIDAGASIFGTIRQREKTQNGQSSDGSFSLEEVEAGGAGQEA